MAGRLSQNVGIYQKLPTFCKTRFPITRITEFAGSRLAAVRYCFDFGCYPTADPARMHEGEWNMTGGAAHADSIIVASEPLTRDTSSWVELPEYGALFAEIRSGRPRVSVRLLD